MMPRASRAASLLITGVLCVAIGGCGASSSATPTLLVVTPNPNITAAPLPRFHAPCQAPKETGKVVSRMVFAGPCALTETKPVRCIHKLDDFYAYIHRNLKHGWHFDVTINIEYYTHPDTYTKLTQLYIQLSKGDTVDAWGQDQATATVTAHEASLVLVPTNAPGYAGTIQVQSEIVSGTLVCTSGRT
jgi:hypothetical protein